MNVQRLDLYYRGKRKCDIIREYAIANFLLDKWMIQAENKDHSKKDNRSELENELLELRKKYLKKLVYQEFISAHINFTKLVLFHTDRGREFDNNRIDDILLSFNITRSLMSL